MIPLKLTLHNFMCYRDNVPPLNFESIHTACISGSNGHGKSALIDAITWALWGETRAAGDDDLVHTGQMEAQVDFEFAVGNQRYDIIRKHAKPKSQKTSGQTILEFRMITPDGPKILTGDSIIQTQQKIIKVLHMDYETFINSAFIRQGHSNEFTRKRPGERKQVLSNILQLSVYDDLEENAKNLSKEQLQIVEQIEAVIAGLQEELCRRIEYQAEYEKSYLELQQAESSCAGYEAHLGLLRKDKALLDNKMSQLNEISGHIHLTEQNYKRWLELSQQCHQRIESYAEILSQQEAIEQGYRQLTAIKLEEEEAQSKSKIFNSLKDTKHNLELSVIKAGNELNRAQAILQNSIAEILKSIEKLPEIRQELQQMTEYLKRVDGADQENQIKKEKGHEIKNRLQWLASEQTRLKNEIKDIDEKLKMLSQQNGAICPLCESELGEDGQMLIEKKYIEQKKSISESLQKNMLEIKSLSSESISLENEIKLTDDKIRRAREASQTKIGRLEKSAADASELGTKCEEQKKELLEIERRLDSKDFARSEQASLSDIEKEIGSLAYDPQKHERLKIQTTALLLNEELKRKLDEAKRRITEDKASEEQAHQTSEELRLIIERDNHRLQDLSCELNSLKNIGEELQQAEKEFQLHLSRQTSLREIVGAAKARLERMEELEKRVDERKGQLEKALRQEKIYKDLAHAFGKKGIQAMLMEIAIPEIESEANRLLMRMTDGRMTVKLETQKATKKGEIQETLDILISDGQDTRDYEMFSGGEAFRIDFAIRIALSRLLARRAGAPLPTLIIDEGFGTQDSNGIEKIKEAITAIQDDFEKILVITHILDFKDAFPQQIDVVKTPEGSTVYLN